MSASTVNNFVLFDVGCSGGVCPAWYHLFKDIEVHAFDPLVDEIETLRKHNSHANTKFLNKYVVSDTVTKRGTPSWHWAKRSSSTAALSAEEYAKRFFNRGNELKYTDESITLDAYCRENNVYPNFIKIDTDGFDYDVLKGSLSVALTRCLGVLVECNLHRGPGKDGATNSLTEIDTLINPLGYSLFAIFPTTYTRKELPGTFLMNLFAQTHGGVVAWCDALFLRDLVREAQSGQTVEIIDVLQMIKLVSGLHHIQWGAKIADYAAELLQFFRTRLSEHIDVDAYLNNICYEHHHEPYENRMRRFAERPESFFPQ